MSGLENILAGLALAITPTSLLLICIGLVIGFIVGVLPGFSSPNAAAILLPFSLAMAPQDALILFAAVYSGTTFAGAVPAILLNIPGTAGAAATTLDGRPMALAGQADLAIGVARAASAFGGAVGLIITLAIIGPMSTIALKVGPPELFLIALFGLSIIASVVGKDVWKGLAAGLLGMLIASMSADPISAQGRMTFGILELYQDIPIVAAVIGLFAFSEMIFVAGSRRLPDGQPDGRSGKKGVAAQIFSLESLGEIWQGVLLTVRTPFQIVRAAVVGVVLGAVPGVGAAVANFVSYGIAKRQSKSAGTYGKGNPEGVIASEACDSALAGGTMIPTLTLGIPGNATTAVMLAALYLHGIAPGPQVMAQNAPIAYAVLLALLISSVLILPIGVLLASPLTAILSVRREILVPLIIIVSTIGAFAVRNSLVDVYIAIAFGFLGVGLRLAGYPIIPVILGLILGPMAEGAFVRSLMLARFDISIFWRSTLSQVFIAALCMVLLLNVARTLRGKWKHRSRKGEA